jgi:FAD binding domain/Berberine and berberine like
MTGLRIAKTADGVPDDRAIEAFRARLRGELLRPGDAGYEAARQTWNCMIDERPALIVSCASVADVINSVNFARANDLPVTVRGRHRNVADSHDGDDGLVIDLSLMKGIRVDPERRTAHAQAGVTWGELDRKTQVFGLATPGGIVSSMGTAGLTMESGMGWLRRKYGLSRDNLLSVDVVTADGRFLTASEAENPDLLFWGIRNGGNFGVVTSLEYRLYPVGPETMFCFVLYPGARTKEVLRFYDEYMAQAPDEVSPLGILGRVPYTETFPSRWRGEPYVALMAMYDGDVEEGERVLHPLCDLGDPIADLSAAMPYTKVQTLLDKDHPNGRFHHRKSLSVSGLSDEVIEHLMAHAESAPSRHSTIGIWYQGGAMSRAGTSGTAHGGQSMPILLGVEANWEEPHASEKNVAWVRNCVTDMRRFSDGSTYPNIPGFPEEEGKLRAAHSENHERMVALKNEYDPTNLFSFS